MNYVTRDMNLVTRQAPRPSAPTRTAKASDPGRAARMAKERADIRRLSVFITEGETAEARKSAANLVQTLRYGFIRRYGESP
jgi:hypothetical protein